jgi:2-keto-myo-inositol isomerase
MSALRLAVNRTAAPNMELGAFLDCAKRSGAEAVEIRNDIEGREFANGMPASEVRARVTERGLAVASVNALQRFNDWTQEREREARSLFAYAAALGAPGIVMCPVIDSIGENATGWSETERLKRLRHALRAIRAIASDTGVIGYVEPLGMAGSTLNRQREAADAIADVDGFGPLMICYDTFQFYRACDDELVPGMIGLVHVSGITRTDLPRERLTEPDRVFVDAADICDNVGRLRTMRAHGYRGYVSMEPFNPLIQAMPDASESLSASFDYLKASLRAAGDPDHDL